VRYIVDMDAGLIWPHGIGVALAPEQARAKALEIAERFGVEGIPLQDPPVPPVGVYRPDATASDDDPPPHDDLSSPARPA
jgi:hypothetical protein